jgi:two-component system KDP operon response regulator KdpE
MSAATRILVVDDETPIRRLLRTALSAEGYEVLEAEDGDGALAMAAREKPDAVLLDLGLPDQDGIEVLSRLREWSPMPVVVLTARDAEAQKIAALDAGADDYVTKPFGMGELLARLRTALRHRLQREGTPAVFHAGNVSVDLARRIVTVAGAEVKLSPKEYDLLRALARHAGRVLTHQMLLKDVWGPAHLHDTQYLRVYVRQLRRKLGDETGALIQSEPGVGYRLADA